MKIKLSKLWRLAFRKHWIPQKFPTIRKVPWGLLSYIYFLRNNETGMYVQDHSLQVVPALLVLTEKKHHPLGINLCLKNAQASYWHYSTKSIMYVSPHKGEKLCYKETVECSDFLDDLLTGCSKLRIYLQQLCPNGSCCGQNSTFYKGKKEVEGWYGLWRYKVMIILCMFMFSVSLEAHPTTRSTDSQNCLLVCMSNKLWWTN